jgi:hypothetical protein
VVEETIDDKDLPNECLHCAKRFDATSGKKKWSLAQKLNLNANLTVYEGLNMFYTHYKGEYPLAKLEPILPKGEEQRLLCAPCGLNLNKFCAQLQVFTESSSPNSIISGITGSLEDEKADWKGLLGQDEEEPAGETREERVSRRTGAAGAEKKISYKEVDEDADTE